MSEGKQSVIETFSLTKVFGDWWGRAKVIAVDNLDLKIRRNEIYGLLGPNGSGKTTTLKMMLGLLYPTKGKVVVLGGDSRDTKINSRLGYLPEDSYLYKYLNARETLDFYGRIFGLPRQVRKSRIETLLEMVGLTGMANRPVGTYSKGMARRIGLAQALINDPDVLILDEPTSGMDPIGTRQMKDLFVQLARRGKTILLCSHLLADVEDVCDRIGILYGGRMQIEGDVESLLRQRDEKQIRTGSLSDSAIEKIKQIVRAEDVECQISSPMVRLEEFFVQTVVEAQQRHQPTSGAVSTTAIGGFLTEEPGTDILEKLVSADVSIEKGTLQTEETKVPEEVETTRVHDSGLLEKLTKTSAAPPEPEIVSATEPVESTTAGSDEVKRQLLEKLTGGKENPDEQTESEQTGDDENA